MSTLNTLSHGWDSYDLRCFLFAIFTLSLIGEAPLSSVLCDFEKRYVPVQVKGTHLSTYGTIDGGLETMRLAVPRLTHEWAIRQGNELPPPWTPNSQPAVYKGPHRFPPKLLQTHPVDVIFWDQGYREKLVSLAPSPLEDGEGAGVGAGALVTAGDRPGGEEED